jgi:hypothetical protein
LIRDLAALPDVRAGSPAGDLTQYGLLGADGRARPARRRSRLGVLPPAASLTIATQTAVGLAWAMKSRGEADLPGLHRRGRLEPRRVARSGEPRRGQAAADRLRGAKQPLGAGRAAEQSAAARCALRAEGYGMPGVTVFGNDPDEVAAACSGPPSAPRRRRSALVESRPTAARAMPIDDDRFQGTPTVPGYECREERRRWEAADPVALYERLIAGGVLDADAAKALREDAARQWKQPPRRPPRSWPTPADYRERVSRRAGSQRRPEPAGRHPAHGLRRSRAPGAGRGDDRRPASSCSARTSAAATAAFGVTAGSPAVRRRPLPQHADAESAIVGCGVGAALAGLRPVVEMQFADFLASGFNALGQQRREGVLALGPCRCRWSSVCPVARPAPASACWAVGRTTASARRCGSCARRAGRSSRPRRRATPRAC